MITQIRVPAKWQSPIWEKEEEPRYSLAVFTLGEGPCGKTVEMLTFTIDATGVYVYQCCSDREKKTFFYPMHTLTGRVEITEE